MKLETVEIYMNIRRRACKYAFPFAQQPGRHIASAEFLLLEDIGVYRKGKTCIFMKRQFMSVIVCRVITYTNIMRFQTYNQKPNHIVASCSHQLTRQSPSNMN